MKSLLLLLFVAGPALADDGALLRCRDISEATKRLACYDALVLTARASNAAIAQPAAPVAQAAGAVSAIPAAVPDQGAAKRALEQSFGMEYNKKTVLESIDSHIPGEFDGWGPRQKMTLANGQVWMVVDDSDGVVQRTNPKVVISRGVLGAIYMEIEGTRKAPKVRRLQ